jgi:DNA repair photolyase
MKYNERHNLKREKMIICLTTSDEGIAITRALQEKKLAKYVIHHVLHVLYPFQDLEDDYGIYRRAGIELNFFPRPPILYSFESYYWQYEAPNYQTSHPNAAEEIDKTQKRFLDMDHVVGYGECMVEFCTTMDLWSSEAQEHNLGRKFLETFLSFPDCNIQILTKNAALVKDFDVIEKHKDRVYVGMYIHATPDKSDIFSIIEPQTSRIEERMEVLRKAKSRGFYTCCIFYPLFHGIADSPEQIDELVRFAEVIRALELVIEPIDHRDPLLMSSMRALMDKGFEAEAAFIGRLEQINNRSRYVVNLVSNIRQSFKRYYNKRDNLFWLPLHILLWPSGLTATDIELIKKEGKDLCDITWLNKPPTYFSGWINYKGF